jgi:uncharacterized damage-inducible protein DinB
MPKMDASLPTGVDPRVAVWCAGLDSGQGRMLDLLKDLGPDQLAKAPAGLSNSLATLAVHVAATEVRMAYRLMGKTVPADVPTDLQAEFLIDQPQNPLPQPRGETAESLRAKLEKARGVVKQALAALSEADLDREIRLGPERTATVRWALGILPTHQMQHFGQMQMIRKLV